MFQSFFFYYLKLKQPISCLQNGIMRIQNNDLDFSLPILSNDEMGQLCAAFEEMRSELLKSNRLLWQQAEERKRLNAAFSHDLRNPITVLKGSVKLLRQGIQDEQTIDRLESYTLRIEQYVEAMSSVQKLEQLSVKPKEIRRIVLQSELQETAWLLALSKKSFCFSTIRWNSLYRSRAISYRSRKSDWKCGAICRKSNLYSNNAAK